MARDTNVIQDLVDMCLFQVSYEKTLRCHDRCQNKACFTGSRPSRQEGKTTSYCQMFYNLLETSAIDVVGSKAVADMNNMQAPDLTAVDYSIRYEKTPYVVALYLTIPDSSHFIEGLHLSI